MHPRRAVRLPTLGMNGANLLEQRLIGPRPGRRRAVAPRVVAAGGDTQDPAHGGDVVRGLLLLHESKARYGFDPVSLAKKVAATL